MDRRLPGSSGHWILQAVILEWIAMPCSGDLSDPGTKPKCLVSPALEGGFFINRISWEAQLINITFCISYTLNFLLSPHSVNLTKSINCSGFPTLFPITSRCQGTFYQSTRKASFSFFRLFAIDFTAFHLLNKYLLVY